MLRKILILVGGLLASVWGTAHLFPTGSVVKGFGNLTQDNVRIITMEWMNEGFTLIFIGALVISVTLANSRYDKTTRLVYLLTFIMLQAMSVLSLFTGFRIDFLPYKLCPLIFSISGILIFQGFFLRQESGKAL